ncbi:MAG: hypothetical protein KGI00_00305 [Candidatus Micrarchaeota archaeon]|nr:hypothetical protein [Candidatus Micrarchaeota archaeon]MDE1823950.1 hypothetical protein [Candidatus Micrarchaeota archaeon]MDE1849156.1 hypothetical protein [Candidatus Micrarchaeota archaeon]
MQKPLLAFILSICIASIAYSQGAAMQGKGNSTLLMDNYTAILLPGTTNSIGYVLLLTNGNYSTTTINIRNSAQLGRYGIMTTLTNPSNVPTFFGYLNVSVSPSARLGLYQIDLNASGGDPTVYDEVVNVIVLNQTMLAETNSSSNSPSSNATYTPKNFSGNFVNYTVSTTVPPYQNQSASASTNATQTTYLTIPNTAGNATNRSQNTTVKSGTQGGNIAYALIIAAIVIIAAAYIVISLLRRKK